MSGAAEVDVVADFLATMESHGIRPVDSITHALLRGERVRFRADGDSRPNSWAVLYLDGRPAGAFGCHKRQIRENWKAQGERPIFTKEQRRAYAAEMRAKRDAAAAAKLAEEEAVAQRAAALMGAASAADPDHSYLQRKRIGTAGLYQHQSRLLVPMRDACDKLWNIQSIDAKGKKLFLAGARTKGLCWSVQGTNQDVFVGEGVATMAAIHRATHATCYAAFSAGNLTAGAELARLIHPDAEITICADDDAHLIDHPTVMRNVGLDAAHAAAAAVGGRVAVPPRSN